MNASIVDYMLFGLRVRSDLELQDLPLAKGIGAADVLVRSAPLDVADTPIGLSVHDESLVLTIEGIARFRISHGSEIIVEAGKDVDPRNVRLFLLGSAFGALLHQRGLLPLHANAVEVDGRAVAFMGPSGAGKSTLAAWFHDLGFPIIADDVCVVRFDEGRALVASGLPRLRLWRDALEASGRDPQRHERSASALIDVEKYDVPIAKERVAAGDLPLAAVYLLDLGEFAISQLAPVASATAVIENTYRGGFVNSAGQALTHWRTCTELVRTVPVFRASRTRHMTALDAEARALLAHAKTMSVETAG